jgi:hypothetical protein
MPNLIAEFRKTLKLVEVEELADLYVYRPLAFLLVKGIARTEITPNQLTLFSLIVGVLGGVSYGLGRRPAVVLGAILYALSIVVDCADGQLARLKKNGTPLGRILDGLIDYVVTVAVYIGLAVGLDPGPGRRTVWILLLAAAGLSNVVHSAALDYYRFRFVSHVVPEWRDEDAEYREFEAELKTLRSRPGNTLRKSIIRIYLKYLSLQKKMTRSRSKARPAPEADRGAFYRKNKAVMRGWTFLGSTTFGSLTIGATLAGRIDIFFWGRIVAANLLAAVLFFIQRRIDHGREAESAS